MRRRTTPARSARWICRSLLCPSLLASLSAPAMLASGQGAQPLGPHSLCTSAVAPHAQPATPGNLALLGLTPGAVVARRIAVRAKPPSDPAVVLFFLDDIKVWTATAPPYSLGPLVAGTPAGYTLVNVASGSHTLRACASLPDGETLVAAPVPFTVVPDINNQFSDSLAPYANHPSAQQHTPEELLRRSTTPAANISQAEQLLRLAVLRMYISWGIDPTLDAEHDQSEVLLARRPQGAQPAPPQAASLPLSMRFSRDAPFYHQIPHDWPRVALPDHYFSVVQLNEAYGGDGIGFGEVVASAADPILPATSQWYDVASTLRTFAFRMPRNWANRLPTLAAGDRHLIFVDPVTNTFISSYKTSLDPATGGPKALYISAPHSLGDMADAGGSNAAGFADLPVLIQPGEATDPDHDIPHAIGGAIHRTWAARVYPASSWDAGVLTSADSCTHHGFTNTGVIPYGAILQLDPNLDLRSLNLTRPAYRILRAMQVYGYYVMDYGCADLDIYTAIDANELQPFGGPWGNANGRGVQNEIESILSTNRIYVVPPLLKR